MTEETTKNASLDSITDTPGERLDGDSEKATSELSQLAQVHKTFKSELGLLGSVFGGRTEKPGNISGLVLVLSFLLLGLSYVCPPEEGHGITFERMLTGLLSVVTLILGYLFGSNNRS